MPVLAEYISDGCFYSNLLTEAGLSNRIKKSISERVRFRW